MKRYLPFIIIVVVLAVAVGLSLILLRSKGSGVNSNSTFAKGSSSPVTPSSSAPNQSPSNSAGLTKPNVKVSSPVVLEEYGDYQCPPCGQIYPELKQIEHEYGNQVQIVFHHFPLAKMHKNALVAAHAAEAARNQNKFWHMHDPLYRNQ